MKITKLEALRITLSVQKPGGHNVLRHSLDLYNDNQVEKLVRKIVERLEMGTSIIRRAAAIQYYRKLAQTVQPAAGAIPGLASLH